MLSSLPVDRTTARPTPGNVKPLVGLRIGYISAPAHSSLSWYRSSSWIASPKPAASTDGLTGHRQFRRSVGVQPQLYLVWEALVKEKGDTQMFRSRFMMATQPFLEAISMMSYAAWAQLETNVYNARLLLAKRTRSNALPLLSCLVIRKSARNRVRSTPGILRLLCRFNSPPLQRSECF